MLEEFTRTHPEIDLELTVALSSKLINGFESGDLDLVFCKRPPGDERGDLVWRDDIAWIGRADMDYGRYASGSESWPLVLYRPPSITRSVVIGAIGSGGDQLAIGLYE